MADLPVCPKCDETAERPDARFCESCGTPFVGAPMATTPSARGCRCATPEPGSDGFCEACGLRVAPSEAAPVLPGYEFAIGDRLAIACDRGIKHPTNQDHGAVARRGDGDVLMVVCDGVSSAVDAEVASRVAVEAALAAFLAAETGSLADRSAACVVAASEAVVALNDSGDPDGGPATTIILAVVRGREAAVAWVGDSRAYLVMPSVPEELLTRDDSWCCQVVDEGRMTYAEAIQRPEAHMITQWLGMASAELRIRQRSVAIPPGKALLLCSDGLWNYVDTAGALGRAVTEAAQAGSGAAYACRRLVALANGSGGRDNITVAIHEPG